MFKSLLLKEYKENINHIKLFSSFKYFIDKLISFLISFSVAVILYYLLKNLNNRFVLYGVEKEVFTLILASMIIFFSVILLHKYEQTFYKDYDNSILVLPIPKISKMLTKFIIYYLNVFLNTFFIILIILLAFVNPKLNFTMLFRIILIIISIPTLIILLQSLIFIFYAYIKKFLQKFKSIQIILALIIAILFMFFYQKILALFIGFINNDRLESIFNEDNVEILLKISDKLVFIKPHINFYYNNSNINLYFIILLISLICITCAFLILFYSDNYFNKIVLAKKYNLPLNNKSLIKIKKNNLNLALVKKELILIFRNSNSLFSYVLLLVILPFTIFVIYNNIKVLILRIFGKMFLVVFVLFLILLFSTIINSFGTSILKRENVSTNILKMIPVAYNKQLKIKYYIALVFMAISLLFTVIFGVNELGVNIYSNIILKILIFIISLFVNGHFILSNMLFELKYYQTQKEENYSIILRSLFVNFVVLIISIVFVVVLNNILMADDILFINYLYLGLFAIIIIGLYLIKWKEFNKKGSELFRKVEL